MGHLYAIIWQSSKCSRITSAWKSRDVFVDGKTKNLDAVTNSVDCEHEGRIYNIERPAESSQGVARAITILISSETARNMTNSGLFLCNNPCRKWITFSDETICGESSIGSFRDATRFPRRLTQPAKTTVSYRKHFTASVDPLHDDTRNGFVQQKGFRLVTRFNLALIIEVLSMFFSCWWCRCSSSPIREG